MQHFKLSNIASWQGINPSYEYFDNEGVEQTEEGEVLLFKVGSSRRRNIKIKLNCVSKTIVWASHSKDMAEPMLLASGEGVLSVEVSTLQNLYVQVHSQDGAPVFVTGTATDHRRAASTEAKYTSMEMRPSQNTHFEQMQMIAQYNQRLQQEQHNKQMEAITNKSSEIDKKLKELNDAKKAADDDSSKAASAAAKQAQEQKQAEDAAKAKAAADQTASQSQAGTE